MHPWTQAHTDIYRCTDTQMHIDAHIHTQGHTGRHMNTGHSCTQVHRYTDAHGCTHTQSAHRCTQLHTCTHTNTDTHRDIHRCTQVHTSTHTLAHRFLQLVMLISISHSLRVPGLNHLTSGFLPRSPSFWSAGPKWPFPVVSTVAPPSSWGPHVGILHPGLPPLCSLPLSPSGQRPSLAASSPAGGPVGCAVGPREDLGPPPTQ